MFVGVNIDGTHERKITRTATPWRFDGRLDVADQIGDEVYSEQKNVLDRGHMVRREDPIWGEDMEIARRANIDTFHFTNACPQMAQVNQQVRLGLEDYILRNTRTRDMRVSVFTGPVFTGSDFPHRGALVPKSFWKVVAVVTDEGRPSATAYEVSQEEQLSALEFAFGKYKTFQCSIRSIEGETALSFGDLSLRRLLRQREHDWQDCSQRTRNLGDDSRLVGLASAMRSKTNSAVVSFERSKQH